MIYIVSPFENSYTGRGNRNLALQQALASQNINVKLISSDWDHGRKQKILLDSSNDTNEVLLNVPGYVQNLSIWRVITHWVFAVKMMLYLLRSKYQKKKDIIIVNSIPPECIFLIALFCRGKVIVDIRDIWPDAGAAYSFSLRLALFNLYCSLFYHISLRPRFDYVVVARSFIDWIKKYCPSCKHPNLIPLGSRDFQYSGVSIKPRYVYLGGLTPQFDLREFEFLKNEDKLYVIGSGPLNQDYKDFFPKAVFTGVLNRDDAMSIASNSDYLLFPSNPYAKLPNKIFDYLSLKKPIIIGKNISKDVMNILSNNKAMSEVGDFSVVWPSTSVKYQEADFIAIFVEIIFKDD